MSVFWKRLRSKIEDKLVSSNSKVFALHKNDKQTCSITSIVPCHLQLKAGDPVYVNFAQKEDSLDSRTSCENDSKQVATRQAKTFTLVMLNSFQHLTSFVCSLLACKLLKQVQEDQKCVIACNDGKNFPLSTKNSHPIQGRSKTWTHCIRSERQVEKCLA